jgi:ATP-dependent Clp protease ATP-binding subunit ClpA
VWTLDRFTKHARNVLTSAEEEARDLNDGFVGTEHILLGMLAEDGCVARQALTAGGVSIESARKIVAELNAGSDVSVSPTDYTPYTPLAKKALRLAVREALQIGTTYIGSEHLLLAVIRLGSGGALQVLGRLGVDSDEIRREVLSILPKATPEEVAPTGSAEGVPQAEEQTGTFCTIRIVAAGRGITDYGRASNMLLDAARRLWLRPEEALAGISREAVDTNAGPGIALSVTYRIDNPLADVEFSRGDDEEEL